LLSQFLILFVLLKFAQYFIERYLAKINRAYYLEPLRQKEAREALGLSQEDLDKSLAYATDRYRFSQISGWVTQLLLMVFLIVGGLGYFERLATNLAGASADNQLVVGLLVFALIGVATTLYGLPFSYYNTFVIEQKHGFNRQTRKGFILDMIKGLVIGGILGGLILSVILWIMAKAGVFWWVWAWVAMSSFSILTMWLYPSLLAPLFNKFSPLEEGELRSKIHELAEKVSFKTSGLFVMDASKRSSHGNAYFTGVAGKKRIVLFDTLVNSLKPKEIVAVLAHELGHFKLNHVRWMLIRSVLMTGLTFYLLSLFLPFTEFYTAFGLSGVSTYGALIVFSLWFSLIDFLLQPFESYLSRRNEFAADRFALKYTDDGKSELSRALLKLREQSHSVPISHPVYSAFYYSHPPILERLKAMGYSIG
jgi:STE24 endopeptidase